MKALKMHDINNLQNGEYKTVLNCPLDRPFSITSIEIRLDFHLTFN